MIAARSLQARVAAFAPALTHVQRALARVLDGALA